MKKLLLIGRSEAGKTSLIQCLKGEMLHYEKTQTMSLSGAFIDSPGEYAQTVPYGRALALYAYEADVVGLLISADEPFTLFSPGITSLVNRPVIGIVTGIDKPEADIALAESRLRLTGCETIFRVSAYTGEGISELLEYLSQK